MATNISYGGNSLQTATIITSNINHESMPKSVSDIFRLQNWDKFVVPYADQFEPKSIIITGTIVADTVANLDNQLDTFRSYFTGTNKNLDIDYGGSTRRYVIARVDNPMIDRPNGLSWATFTLTMVSGSHGQNVSANTLLSASGRTAQAYTDTITVLGSAPYQQPLIVVQFTAGSGGTAKTVSVGNDANGQAINVTRNWSNTEKLTIDVANQSVKIGTTEVAFTGGFPEFAPGTNTISYLDDWNSRTFTITVTQNALFL